MHLVSVEDFWKHGPSSHGLAEHARHEPVLMSRLHRARMNSADLMGSTSPVAVHTPGSMQSHGNGHDNPEMDIQSSVQGASKILAC